jgi:5-methylcytosine-specific restriction endonuclease McrA
VANDAPSQPSMKRAPRGHIPNQIKRQVFERDGYRCTYTSPSGHRCQSRQFLQIHHEKPWARHGPDTLDNLRLLCAAHNQLLAEQEFGRQKVHI